MNYDTITYNEYILNIITTRGQWNIPEGEYWEGHHILPKSGGGTGKHRSKDSNIIWLYPKEHYIAHYLLAKENPDNLKYARAFICMQGMNHHKDFLEKDAELFAKARLELNRYASMTAIEAAKQLSPAKRSASAQCGGQGNKKRLENSQQNKEWRKTCCEVHRSRDPERKNVMYQKVSNSLSAYYETIDKNNKDWIIRQDKNKQTNIESSKKWRAEFKEIFGNTPESYRKYGLLKEVSQLFKDIRYKDKSLQQEAVNKLNSKIEEIV